MPAGGSSTTALLAFSVDAKNSAPISLNGFKMWGVLVPTLDTTTLKIQVSLDGTNFFDAIDTSGNVVCSWASGTFNKCLDGDALAKLAPYPYLRFACGSDQTANRTFTVYLSRL